MLRFAHPEYFYLLLVIPAALLLFVMNGRARRKRIALFGDESLMKRLLPDRSAFRVNLRLVVWSLAMAALAVALASPQLGSKLDKVKARGVDIMVALDVSNSMLSQDVKPNRLDNAKLAISKLIDNLRSDRIGMVVFAGKGYVQLPITTDYAAAKMFLSNINTTLVPTQGTAIGQALEMASESFNEEARSRAIIVITDGENHEGDAVETARQIAETGVKIYTIGIGSPSGAPIPEFAPNGTQTGFKKDNTGNTVVTKLNEGMLQQIAAAGNGAYVYAANTNSALKKVQEEIRNMAQNDYDTRLFSDYVERFQYFVAVALVLLILELLIGSRRGKWASRINLFDESRFKSLGKKAVVAVALLVLPGALLAQSENRNIRKGNNLYNDNKFTEAELEYRRALEKNTHSPKAAFNLGNAQYRQKNFDEAASTWAATGERTDLPENVRAGSWYNTGNSMMQQQKYQEAVEAFKNALKINPKDEDARYNLAYAQKKLKNQQDQNKDQNKDQQKKDQNKDQQKQDQQKQDQNKDQQKQDQQKQDQQKQDQKQDQQKQDQQQQQQQQQKQELQKRDAERMLEAMKNAEKKTLENVQKKQVPSQSQRTDKDWQ